MQSLLLLDRAANDETRRMTPDQAVNEARTGQLRPVYLLVGEESYLEGEVVRALKQAALAGGVPGLNDEYLQAGEVPVDREEVRGEMASSGKSSFFRERR